MIQRKSDSPPLRHEYHYGRVIRCDPDRPASLAASLRAAVERAPDREALVDGERRMTYGELGAAVDGAASAIADMGVKRGDRVALLLGNRLETVVLLYACAVAGAIAVPMNLRQSAHETEIALNESGARLLFHERDASLPDFAATAELARAIEVADDIALPRADPRTFGPVQEEAPFAILFTSGTTGKPKGAVLTHFNVAHSIMHFRRHYALREGERTLLAVPASHVTGLVALIAVTVDVAGCLVIMRQFQARAFLDIAAAEAIGYTLLVPAMYVLVLMNPAFDPVRLANWRVGGFGGAPMPPSAVADLAASLPGLTLHNTYGATETTSPAVIMPGDAAAARCTQVGLPVACCDLLIVDEEGRECAKGATGEIWIAGPMVIPGYWNNADANAKEFAGGYWKSGDIGSVDDKGFVTLHDRKKDMINRGGFKIYSAEVENILCSDERVIEVAVVGRPCPVLGERVEAFIHADDHAIAEELQTLCAARLSDYKVPERFHFEAQPLPRNANGKIMKAALRARLDKQADR